MYESFIVLSKLLVIVKSLKKMPYEIDVCKFIYQALALYFDQVSTSTFANVTQGGALGKSCVRVARSCGYARVTSHCTVALILLVYRPMTYRSY